MTQNDDEKANPANTIMAALKSDGMEHNDVEDAFALFDKGYDIQIRFLSDDPDDDSLKIMISWYPIPVASRSHAGDEAYGHWKEVLKAKRDGTLEETKESEKNND
jgi:hypothetical protein